MVDFPTKMDRTRISYCTAEKHDKEDRKYWQNAPYEEKLMTITYLRECFYSTKATTNLEKSEKEKKKTKKTKKVRIEEMPNRVNQKKENEMHKLIGNFLILVIIITMLGGCTKFQKDIIVSKIQIQNLIDNKFPVDKNIVIARLTLDSPSVYFKEKTIGMKLNYYGNFLQSEIKGSVDFNGEIIYRKDKGAFYLANFEIVEIAVNDANFSNQEKLKAAILKILNNYLEDYAVYRLNPTDFKQSLAKLLLKDLKTEQENLIITIGI